jgi:hypothetical protein
MMRPFQNFVQHKMAEPFDRANNVIYITFNPSPKLVFWSRIVVPQGDFPLEGVRKKSSIATSCRGKSSYREHLSFFEGQRAVQLLGAGPLPDFPLRRFRWRFHGTDEHYPRSRRIEL